MGKKITIVGGKDSIFNQFLYELRAAGVQDDRMRFRKNLFRCSQIMAYEISKTLQFKSQNVTTPLGELEMNLMDEQPVLISILRAGVPMHNGFLDFYDQADNGFVSAFRQKVKGNDFVIKVEYMALPSIEDRTVIIVDPMIASGRSIVLTHQAIIPSSGQPRKVIFAGLIASEEGLDYVQRHVPDVDIFVGAIDNELTAKSYIVPGLGDAGDLAYGSKSSG